MTILGLLLFLAGTAGAILFWLGLAPEALGNLGLSAPGWLGVAVLGAVILWFNRRPGG